MTNELQKKLGQLKKALELGVIDQDTYDSAAATMSAQLEGSGAVAQGTDAAAAGARGVVVKGSIYGDINTGLIIHQAAKPGASRADLRNAYLARMLIQANELPLFAADSANAQIRLSSVYTALLTRRALLRRIRQMQQHLTMVPNQEVWSVSALDAFNREKYLVLLGGPGSGKSTFVNFVALCMAGALLGSSAINLQTLTAPLLSELGSQDEEAKPQRWDHGVLFPVYVVLRDFASELPPPGTSVSAETLWAHIVGRLEQAALGDFAPHLHEELMKRGGLILLDGLDEVPDSLTRRVQVKQAVQDFVASFGKCRFLVTSRTYAYTRQDWMLNNFADDELLPFTSGQIRRFIDAWYTHMHELLRLSESDAKGRAELLKGTIERNERLAELAARPLLLTLIARLHTERGDALPEKREELYQQVVELLLNQWESLKVRYKPDGRREIEPSLAEWLNVGRGDIRHELDKLAFEAHRDQPKVVGTADIRQERLVTALLNASPHSDVKPRLLESYLRDRAGILAAHGEGLYQFPHRTFQEYLAACHLTAYQFPDEVSRLLKADPNRWREVVLLAGAKASRGTASAIWLLAEELCPSPPGASTSQADEWAALIAGQALAETADLLHIARRDEAKRDRVRDWQLYLLTGDLPLVERAQAGRNLAVLGDPRRGVGLRTDGLPDIDWVLIPDDGKFIYGEGQTQRKLRLPAYRISRYPITYAQFQSFADAPDGFHNPRWWKGLAADENHRRAPGEQWFKYANHPRDAVSWYDAVAFCRWLSNKLGAEISLPSERQWEKAARGQDGRVYPWGDNYISGYANINETLREADPNSLKMTSAVGMYPQGQSPYGVLDMCGNVMEWCLNERSNPSNVQLTGNKYRMMRGGCWDFDHILACATYGVHDDPDARSMLSGFRVVAAPVS